jgi:hypothetical protein
VTTTPNKGYTLPVVGSDYNTWGNELNANWDIVDLNLGGLYDANVAGSSNVTITTSEAQNLAHVLTGSLTGNIEYVLPNVGGFYLIDNATSGTFAVDVIASGGTGVVVPQGSTQLIWSDGTNAYPGAPAVNGDVYIYSSTSLATAVPISSNVQANVTSITLFPGHWLVWGNGFLNAPGLPTQLTLELVINTFSATLPTQPGGGGQVVADVSSAGSGAGLPCGQAFFSLSVATTLYLVVQSGYNAGPVSAFGFLGAVLI